MITCDLSLEMDVIVGMVYVSNKRTGQCGVVYHLKPSYWSS